MWLLLPAPKAAARRWWSPSGSPLRSSLPRTPPPMAAGCRPSRSSLKLANPDTRSQRHPRIHCLGHESTPPQSDWSRGHPAPPSHVLDPEGKQLPPHLCSFLFSDAAQCRYVDFCELVAPTPPNLKSYSRK
uniref:Uncharacterized protein n=1 Tax=Arundo donax TaxID=35708 RepID=A0A0A8Y2N0_ARUDO